MQLHTLPKRHGRKAKRLGRGHGSGRGITSGRGTKGQKARTGGKKGLAKRALKSLVSHLPKKRGFTSRRKPYRIISLAILERHFQNGDRVTAERLLELGCGLHGYRGWKVLGSGTLTKKLAVAAHAFSNSAERAITRAGGTTIRLRS